MPFLDLLLIAIGLSMDACAVCIGAGASGLARDRRATFRLSFHFGLFQFMMPVIGWYLGIKVAPLISTFDHWIAFALLAFVGSKMILEGASGDEDTERFAKDPSRGWSLVMLSVATSIDALAVGLSIAMLNIDIWYPGIVIGIVTASLSVLGVRMGRKLGAHFGHGMEIAGGIILNLIGIKIVISHLFL